MVYVIDASNREHFHSELQTMFRDRCHVSIERRPTHCPDRFDTSKTIYFLQLTGGTHLASMRLLPTLGEHMLVSVDAHFCERGAPVGRDILELSCFCVAPGTPESQCILLRRIFRAAAAEFANQREVKHFTCVLPVRYLPEVLAGGWQAEPLGLPKTVAGNAVGAILLTITADVLNLCRRQLGNFAPILEFSKRVIA